MIKSYPEHYNKRFKYAQISETNDENALPTASATTAAYNSSTSDDDLNRSSSPLVDQGPLASISNKLMKQNYNTQQQQQQSLYPNYDQYSNFHNHFASTFQPNHNYNQNYNCVDQTQQNFSFYSNAYNQFQHSQLRLNSHRNSTGSTSADSTLSLNSPPAKDENSPPVVTNMQQQLQQRSNYPLNLSNKSDLSNQQSLNPVKNALIPSRVSSSNLNLSTTSGDDSLPLKKRRPVPVEHKDNQYWEKRRKNNESAKRSRDVRRSKEEHISIRVIYLEQENLQLRTECALLRNETEKLRSMLYASNSNNSNQINNC